MQGVVGVFAIAFSDWNDPGAWGHVSLVFPQRPILWAFVALPMVAVAVAIFLLRVLRRPPAANLRVASLGDVTGGDWNVVRINLTTARNLLNNSRLNQNDQVPVVLGIGKMHHPARLELRQIATDTLQLSQKMGEELGVGDKLASNATMAVAIRIPFFRLDLRTVNNPDPGISLQWRLGFLFLLLGVLLPRLIDEILFRG
jgi:hypothetical protein